MGFVCWGWGLKYFNSVEQQMKNASKIPPISPKISSRHQYNVNSI